MIIRWTQDRATHIATRSQRYADATDISIRWTKEAAADPQRIVRDPDPRSRTNAVRIIGYSPAAGFVVTVIARWIDEQLWGATAWKSTGADRRRYEESQQ